MSIIPDPQGFNSFEEWANIVLTELSDEELPLPTSDWRSWGFELLKGGSFADAGGPPPDAFEHWHSWAQEFRRLVG